VVSADVATAVAVARAGGTVACAGAKVEISVGGALAVALGVGLAASASGVGVGVTGFDAGNWPPAAALTPTPPQNSRRVTGRMAAIMRETGRPMAAYLCTDTVGLPT